ncbi:hypothetical protein ACHAXT_011388 [Thalassiosira profunda]
MPPLHAMKHLLPLLLPLAAALPSGSRIPDILERAKRQREQQLGAEVYVTEDGSSNDAPLTDVEATTLQQRLDHFSAEEEGKIATFEQRYFYSGRYVAAGASSSDGEAKKTLSFLCVGGEGPSLDASVLVDSVHCTGDMIGLAEKLHEDHHYDVHLFALEHRYYGESFPPKESGHLRGDQDDASDADEFQVDYVHLSSRQAVKDVAAFVQSPEALGHLNLSTDAAKQVRWITFGASYPGMLSAWSHLLHPEAIYAAVSSSAPIQATLDFGQYYEHVGRDLGDEDVGGSKACQTIVKEGHAQAVALLEGKDVEGESKGSEDGGAAEDGVERVAALFNVCGGAESLKERKNQEVLVGDGLIGIPAQSNDPSCTSNLCNIRGLCNAIVNKHNANPNQSSVEILAGVRQMQTKGSCEDINWTSYIEWYHTPTKQNANDRSWLYQTCSEFGFYQTCNSDSSCPYGRGYHEVSRDLEVCQAVFGIDPDTVKSSVDSTLTYYGGWKLTPNTGDQTGPQSSMAEEGEDTLDGQKRIIFVTGDVDPWTELALTDGNDDHPSISVQGASHHFWTHKVLESDGDAIVAARQTIYDTVSNWLEISEQSVSSVLEEGAVARL